MSAPPALTRPQLEPSHPASPERGLRGGGRKNPAAARIAFTASAKPNIISRKIDKIGMENNLDRGSTGRGRFRWLWVLTGLVFLAAGAWGLWRHQSPPPPPKAAAAQPPRMEGLSLTEIHEGDKTWVLEAKKADFHPEQDTISISVVRVEFFGPGEDIRVKAESGLFNTKTRVLTLKGQVEMQRGDLLVRTSLATFLPAERALLAPEEVVITEPGLKVEGKGLRVELAAKKLVMTQHHFTELLVKDWRGKH
jgi:LPS export ABC transporter protein LptC